MDLRPFLVSSFLILASSVIQVSQPETVLAPGYGPDSPVFTLKRDNEILMYVPSGQTYLYRAANIMALEEGVNTVALGPGTAFDNCGAWLLSAYRDGSIIRGWYHAETECRYDLGRTKKSGAYAESYDGGLTFVKSGYPNNQFLTAPGDIPAAQYDDEGDFHVVRNGDYFFCYFLSSRTGRVHLARSLVSDGGRPGTWWKWHNGAFVEPGLGGNSTPIAEPWVLRQRWVSWNSYLGQWIGFHHRDEGWGLSVSDDGIRWQAIDTTIIESGDQWAGRPQTTTPLSVYLSIVSPEGDSEVSGQEFYVYYMHLGPGEDWGRQALVRQRVRLEAAAHFLPAVGK